jgi:hypothetical protein
MSANLDKAVTTYGDPAARITRISHPVATPGKCAICGKNKHPEGFAATDNFDFEFYGTVYFCADCVGDYARVFGFMSRDQVEDVLAQLQAQKEELEVLRHSVVNLESIVDAYSNLRHIKPSDLPSDVPINVSAEAIDAGDSPSERGTSPANIIGEGRFASGEQSSDERSNESRRDDVHDSTADDVLAELGLT